ncbi:MAG TPA: iron-containing redox enzyme family protein [Pilimelia sp.]|nr:iron-containing redox enzyme family protein [Pilimelia sp.]
MQIPAPRGPVSAGLADTLSGRRADLPAGLAAHVRDDGDCLVDEDLQLALFMCYELHYRGFDAAAEAWEWRPELLALRAVLEQRFERRLRDLVGPVPAVAPEEVPAALAALVAADDGPAVSEFLRRRASRAQFREFVVHRSLYHLREADPHTWAIPRLSGAAKAALVEIQSDEYGGGRVGRMHATLFRGVLRFFDLSEEYGHYLDEVPAYSLAVNNLMSLCGLHRRLRGAIVGHLAAYEMTSCVPNRRYGLGLRRLGADAAAARFYDEHAEADAVHEQIAAHDLCGRFARAEPAQVDNVLFGAAAALRLDALAGAAMLERWAAGGSTLREGQVPCGTAA